MVLGECREGLKQTLTRRKQDRKLRGRCLEGADRKKDEDTNGDDAAVKEVIDSLGCPGVDSVSCTLLVLGP